MKRSAWLLVAMLCAGCHARDVRHGNGTAEKKAEPEAKTDGKPEAKPEAKTEAKKAAPNQKPKATKQISSERPVRTTPAAFFDAAAVRKIQAALSSHGQPVKESGELDGDTHAALVRFQKANAQPATGFPDFDTLKRLGLKPEEVYLGQVGKP